MFSKQNLLDFLAVLLLACIVLGAGISAQTAGLLEPWETSTILTVQHMNQSNITESSFWVPRLGGIFVAQPYLELWSLSALLNVFPEPDAFVLRLPGAIVGILLVLLSFLTVKQISTRRTAWATVLILLTLPMFVLTGKFIHGDIWLILAVALPNLFYLLSIHASTRKMQRTMLVLTSGSVLISFLSGGLFALAILACQCILIVLFLWRNPQKMDVFKPLATRYFIVPLYVVLVVSGCIFGKYVTEARYELEERVYVTLAELNKALDEDRVIHIECRQNQIIGELRVSGKTRQGQTRFILVESAENLNTNSDEIFKLYETEKRTFENYLMWRFQKKFPARTERSVPDIGDAFEMALRFFWYHTNTPYLESTMSTARVDSSALAENPAYAFIRSESMIKDNAAVENDAGILFSNDETLVFLQPDEVVRVLSSDDEAEWYHIETGKGEQGYVSSRVLNMDETSHHIRWTSWLDVLLFGLMPWGCFALIAVVCAFSDPRKLVIARYPFRGEFEFHVDDIDRNLTWTPAQCVLLSWIIVSIMALFEGINHSRHDIFAGLIPFAILIALTLTSPRFWRTFRESLEARIVFMGIAFVCLAVAVYEVYQEPYIVLRYLMTDPLMHWDAESVHLFDVYIGHIIVFIISFVILTLISFTNAAENIQERILSWRDSLKNSSSDSRTSSSSSLIRVSRGGNEPMPYAPAISLVFLATLSSLFLYFDYTPSISDNFTETALIERYFALANQSEPVYLLSGENTQLCQTYRDCEPGYVCQNSRCRISTFSSYSLNVARPITRMEMLQSIADEDAEHPVFYIVPKDALYAINQAYRAMFSPEMRKNLKVLDAPSSRLYLIGNHVKLDSVSPLDAIFPQKLPDDATRVQILADDNILVEGFRMERLDFSSDRQLALTVFYRVLNQIDSNPEFQFSFEISSRSLEFHRPILDSRYDSHRLMPGDLISDRLEFELAAMPSHGFVDVKIGVATANEKAKMHALTTINF